MMGSSLIAGTCTSGYFDLWYINMDTRQCNYRFIDKVFGDLDVYVYVALHGMILCTYVFAVVNKLYFSSTILLVFLLSTYVKFGVLW